jgi:hypothetical protein
MGIEYEKKDIQRNVKNTPSREAQDLQHTNNERLWRRDEGCYEE